MKWMNQYRPKQLLKTGMAVLTSVALLAGLTGCSGNDYDLYQKANDKTEAAKTGVYDLELSVTNEFDTTGMTEEQLKAVNYMKQVVYKGKSTVDENQNALISDSWLNLGGIGFDFTYYSKDDQQYIKYPVLKKYIDLKAMMASAQASPTNGSAGQMPSVSEETQKALSKIWEGLATKDTVKSVEDVIIPTDQGEMKAKHLNIEVSGDAVKSALLESQKLILADPSLKAAIDKQFEKSGVTDKQPITLMTDAMQIEDFMISAYVNADGYLVKDEVKIVMSGLGSEQNSPLKRSTFHMTTVYSQLDQKVNLEFPNITPDQVFQPEELNQEMPSVFKDLIQ